MIEWHLYNGMCWWKTQSTMWCEFVWKWAPNSWLLYIIIDHQRQNNRMFRQIHMLPAESLKFEWHLVLPNMYSMQNSCVPVDMTHYDTSLFTILPCHPRTRHVAINASWTPLHVWWSTTIWSTAVTRRRGCDLKPRCLVQTLALTYRRSKWNTIQ